METRFISIKPEAPKRGFEIMIPCGRIGTGVMFTVRAGASCLYRVVESRIAGVFVLVKGVLNGFCEVVKRIIERRTHHILMSRRCVRSVQLCLSNGGGLRL